MSGLSAERIQEIRARCEKASLAPWVTIGVSSVRYPGCGINSQNGEETSRVADVDIDDLDCAQQNANADFIAHSRQDIPDLLAEIEKYRQCLSDLRNQLCMCSAPDNKPCHWCGVIDAGLKENGISEGSRRR